MFVPADPPPAPCRLLSTLACASLCGGLLHGAGSALAARGAAARQRAAFAAAAAPRRLPAQPAWTRRGHRGVARGLRATGLLEYGGEIATLDESTALLRLKQKRAEVRVGLFVPPQPRAAPCRRRMTRPARACGCTTGGECAGRCLAGTSDGAGNAAPVPSAPP